MTQRPTARYGRRPISLRVRRWAIAGTAALVLAAGVVVAIVGYQRIGTTDVEGTMVAYRLVDDKTVEVTITVTRSDPSRSAVCIVRARSKDGAETGRREVLVAPSTQASVQVTTDVVTSRPPVMGDIYGCGHDIPRYLVGS